MAQQISESYASPALRLGLLQVDHPGAKVTYRLASGEELAIPPNYGGGGSFCVARIEFPTSSGRPPVEGYKSVASKGTADEWNILCSKTLGRALKKAGYPDDLKDLKALVLWRQREAEIAAINSGTTLTLAGGGKQLELERALEEAVAPVDGSAHQETDDVLQPSGDDSHDDVVEAVLVEPRETATSSFSDEEFASLVLDVNSLEGNDLDEFHAFINSNSISPDPGKWSDEDVTAINAWFG